MRSVLALVFVAACTPGGDPVVPVDSGPPMPEHPASDGPDFPTVPGQLAMAGADKVTHLAFPERGPRVFELSQSWFLGFDHRAWGRAGELVEIPAAVPVEADGRVVYEAGGIRSWYENREDGLEQGFDLASRPAGDGPVRVEIGLDTDLLPVLRHDAQVLHLVGSDGLVEVELDNLFASDADGLALESWMELDCTDACVLSLVVDDTDAAYPITIDPRVYANVQVIDRPFNGNPSSEAFGYSIAMAGTTAVVGDPGYNSNRGAAHVFTRSAAGMWSKQADLTGAGTANHRVGTSVDINGTTIVVGAPTNGSGTPNVFVYTGSGSSWTQQAALTRPTGVDGNFGTSVAISGNRLVVGAPSSSSTQGRAATFARTGTTWSSGATLDVSGLSLATNDVFGTSVAIDGATLVVGIPGSDVAAADAGRLAVYTESAGTWSFQTFLSASGASANQALGTSVAMLGDTIVSGAPATGTSTGNAYVFVGSGSSWAQEAQLTPSGSVSPASSRFGSSVGIRLNQVAVGAREHGPNTRGATYTFYRSGSTWNQGSVMQTGNPNGQNEGFAVDLNTTDVMSGAPNGSAKGVVYVYRVQTDTDGDGWTACGGLVTSPCDCNDSNAAINPDATEIEGNTVDENCDDLLAVCGTAPKTGCTTDLAITEVFSSPVSGASSERWIELQNNSGHRVDLRYSVLEALTTGLSNTATLQSNVVVDDGGIVVLAGSTASASNGGITGASALPSGFVLYDDVATLSVRRATSLATLDSVTFTSDSTTGTSRPVGASFSVDPLYATATDNDVPYRWCDGADTYGTGQFGTPGVENDACDVSICFVAQYTYTAGGTLQVNGGLPIQADFTFDENGTAGNVGVGIPPFDLARWFTTSNAGEGEYTRTTTSGSGQTLSFRYFYVSGGAFAGYGSVYSGTRPFGGTLTGGTIVPPTGTPFSSGSWTVVPCP